MNFQGRYWVSNGRLVMVHGNETQGFWGHTFEPDINDRTNIKWDKTGMTQSVKLPQSLNHITLIPRSWDIISAVNPQSPEASISVADCKECEIERKKKLGIVSDPASHQPFVYTPEKGVGKIQDFELVAVANLSDERIHELTDVCRQGPLVVSMAKEIQKWRKLGKELELFQCLLADKLKGVMDGS